MTNKIAYIALAIFSSISIYNAWHYLNIPDTQAQAIQREQLQRITQPNILFRSHIFLDRDQTFVSIPYRYDHDQQLVWLKLDVDPDSPPVQLLLDHPQSRLITSRPQIHQDLVFLYQVSDTYSSFRDFTNNPPSADNLALDPHLANLDWLASINGTPISTDLDLTEFDYVLTTLIPSRYDPEQDLFYYENLIDATNAQVSDTNEITWFLDAPQATSQNPIYIGTINVDYRF